LNLALRDITHIRLRSSHERGLGITFEYNVTIEYGDGSTQNYNGSQQTRGGGLEENPLFVALDTSKDVIESFNFNIIGNLSGDQETYQADVSFAIEETETTPDGNTRSVFTVVDTIAFEDEGVPGRVKEGETHSLVIEESNGSKATSEGFFSDRYQNVFYLPRWKALNFINLQTEETEQLRCEVYPAIVPMGTKIRFQKPGESRESHFVPLGGRTLHFGTSSYDAGTKLNEMEIPAPVIEKIRNP